MDGDDEGHDDERASVEFSPRSPWRQPPIPRTAPRPDSEHAPRWTRREVPGPELNLDADEPTIDDPYETGVRPHHNSPHWSSRLRHTPSTPTTSLTRSTPTRNSRWGCSTRCRPQTSSPPAAPSDRGNGWPPPASARPPAGARSAWSGYAPTVASGRAGRTSPRCDGRSAGLRQITVVNPKGGAGKTVATLMLGLAFGQTRGGFVLAWDNNETQGTLGMRAQQDVHGRTVRDLLRDLGRFGGAARPDR